MDANMIMMIVVFGLIVADIITGLIKAVIKGEFSSKEMRQGLLRKCGTIALVLIAYGLQYAASYLDTLPVELSAVYDGVAVYVILMELASNVENIIQINPELAGDGLRKLFGIRGENDKNAD